MSGRRRALLVGAGQWGQNWARHLREDPGVDLTVWVDLRPELAAEAAERLHLRDVAIEADLARAIEATKPDVVINATAPAAHRGVTVPALEAGLPVLVDKPLAPTMEEAREMVAASERTGVLLMVSQQRTYDPRLAAMRRLIADHLGTLGILRSDFYRSHPQGPYHAEMRSPLLLDMAIHTFDAARYLAGADPVAVYCDDFNLPWSWWTGNAALTAVFDMTGGLRYVYQGSWSVRGALTPWEAQWRADGANGTAVWDGEAAPEAEVLTEVGGTASAPTTRVVADVDRAAPGGLFAPLREFLRALDSGQTPMGECHDNIKSLAMVFGAMESAAIGRRVPIEP